MQEAWLICSCVALEEVLRYRGLHTSGWAILQGRHAPVWACIRMGVILIGAFRLFPGLCGLVMWKLVFALAGKEAVEIRTQEQRHSTWKVFGV